MRRRHAAGSERDLERLLLRVGVEGARGKAVVPRPDALAVELHLVLVPAAGLEITAADERVVVVAHAEGALARAEDLDLAGGVGLHPEHGLGLTYVSEQRAEHERGHAPTVPRGVVFGSWSRSFRRWGGHIHAAFPGKSRHPLRALDERAMELASHDAELRAALFRFVDVTPACRSLDDLARHLTGYLEEVDERPPPIEAAMRMSGTKAGPRGARRGGGGGRAPHGASLHRRRDPQRRAEDDPAPVGERRGRLARPARRGDGHRRPRRTATPRAASTRSRRSPRPPARGRSARCSRRTRSAGSRA